MHQENAMTSTVGLGNFKLAYGPDVGEPPFTTRPEITGTFGVVASTHWLGTAAGMRILERGGNAFDAAVAVGFALQVVEPHLNGIGGEVPIIFHHAETGNVRVICGQGGAPAAATLKAFGDLDLDVIPGSGLLPACIPGSFDAWMTLLKDYGTMPLRDVLEPAIVYARDGYVMMPRISAAIGTVEMLFRSAWPSSAEVYLKDGIPQPGSIFCNPDLAGTYERILAAAEQAGGSREHQIDAARDCFYRGFIAEAIDHFFRNTSVLDTSGRRHQGLLTGADLAGFNASYEDPVGIEYRGYQVLKPGPWSQGPVLLQQLALLKGFDLSDLDPNGSEFIHLVTEVSKLAYADREKFYGDPNFITVPLDVLLSEQYNYARRALVGREASREFRPGYVAGYDHEVLYKVADPDSDGAELGAGEPTMAAPRQASPAVSTDPLSLGRRGAVRGDTVHFDIIDRHGNMVTATPSGGWLQSSPVIPGLGFGLGTRAQMFWLRPGLPAALAPGKRPRTTLSTTMVLRDGKPYMSFGTPGGDQQDQWGTTFLLRHIDHGIGLQQSIDMPMFHNDHMPSSFFPRAAKPGSLTVESRVSTDVQAALKDRGHEVGLVSDWSLGRLSAVSRDGRILRAAANARYMQGYAFGR
jgi:gamma-glutamyltranspeptidase / glutathione hydrolase